MSMRGIRVLNHQRKSAPISRCCRVGWLRARCALGVSVFLLTAQASRAEDPLTTEVAQGSVSAPHAAHGADLAVREAAAYRDSAHEHEAEEAPLESGHNGHLGPKNATEISFAGAALTEFPKGGRSETGIGGGISISHDFTTHYGVELTVHFLRTTVHEDGAEGATTAGHTTVPIDLVFKRSFHASHNVHPYVALGGTMILGGERVYLGVASGLGCDYWFNSTVGMFLEGSFNIVARDGVELELGTSLGPVLRF